MALIIYTFIPYMLISSIFTTISTFSNHKKRIRKLEVIMSFLDTAIFVFSATWLITKLLEYMNIKYSLIIIIFATTLLNILLDKLNSIFQHITSSYSKNQVKSEHKANNKATSKIIKEFMNFVSHRQNMVIFVPVAIIRIIIEGKELINTENIFSFVIIYFIVNVIRTYVRKKSSFYSSSMSVMNLRRGMIIADNIIERDNKYFITEKLNSHEQMNRKFDSALSISDVSLLRQLKRDKKLTFENVHIDKAMAFAPLMFFGVILTLFFGELAFNIVGIL
jgi:hypothetical protein